MTLTKRLRIHSCLFCFKCFSSISNLEEHIRGHIQEKPFECGFCGQVCASKSNMLKHSKTHFKGSLQMNFYCHICQRKFHSINQIISHMVSHPGEKFKCDICDKEFSQIICLHKHRKAIHSQPSIIEIEKNTCMFCLKVFRRSTLLPTHILSHIKERPLKYNQCDYSCTSRVLLRVHKLANSPLSPIQCGYCNSMFKTPVHLKCHERRMHMEKTNAFRCSICPYMTFIQRKLDEHIKSHTREKHHKYKVCGKAYAFPNSLYLHRSLHYSDLRKKIWRDCQICKKTFRSSTNLNVHMKIHSGEKIHECKICKKRFLTKEYLNAHMSTHTKEIFYKCRICHATFYTMASKFRHEQRTHNIGNPFMNCQVCKITMRTALLWKLMQQNHKPRSYECVFYKAKFLEFDSLSLHLRKHISEGASWCNYCRTEFRSKNYLSKHMETCSEVRSPNFKRFYTTREFRDGTTDSQHRLLITTQND